MFQGRFIHPTHAYQCFVHVGHGGNKDKKMYSPSREQWFVPGSPGGHRKMGTKGLESRPAGGSDSTTKAVAWEEGHSKAEATAHVKTRRHGKLTVIGTRERPNLGGVWTVLE